MQITLRWVDLDARSEKNCESCGTNELNLDLKELCWLKCLRKDKTQTFFT